MMVINGTYEISFLLVFFSFFWDDKPYCLELTFTALGSAFDLSCELVLLIISLVVVKKVAESWDFLFLFTFLSCTKSVRSAG